MKRLGQILSASSFHDTFVIPIARYTSVYLKSLPLFIVLTLLTGRYANGSYIFSWTLASGYLIICYLLFAPEQIITAKLKTRGLTRQSTTFTMPTSASPRAKVYAAGLPLMPLKDYTQNQTRLLPGLFIFVVAFIFGPEILLVLLLLSYYLRRGIQ